MLIDIHVHAMGCDASQETMLAGLEEAGLDKAVILSPPPHWDARDHALTMRESADWLAEAVRGSNTAMAALTACHDDGVPLGDAVAAAARVEALRVLKGAPVRIDVVCIDRAGAVVGSAGLS